MKLTFDQVRILDVLSQLDGDLNWNALRNRICAHGTFVSREDFAEATESLQNQQLIAAGESEHLIFHITCKGRAQLIACDARKIFGERVPTEPIVATVCHARDPQPPSSALICLNEDELDDWWESLDVELKADAFSIFALRMHSGEDSHVYVERDRLPAPRETIQVHAEGGSVSLTTGEGARHA